MKSQLAAYMKQGDVQFIFVDRPLGPQSLLPAEAASCAADQDFYWAYHSHLMANQKRDWTAADLKAVAGTLGLDEEAFGQCLDAGTHRPAILDSARKAEELGINFTPAFFLNGQYLSIQSWDDLVEAVKEELNES